jgi:hypothetical protein
MSIVTDQTGQLNIFAKEPKMYIAEEDMTKAPHNERAELLNGRLAMLGIMAAFGAYALTGQIIPGIW